MSKQVSCIVKRAPHLNPHERIEAIGGVDGFYQWKRLEDAAIRDVKADKTAYYTLVGGKRAYLVVATHNGREYLKTENDGYAPNNLLSLRDCPA